jgi:GNAT superfamily N-acetyltransferase
MASERVEAAVAAFAAMSDVFPNALPGGWSGDADGAAAMVTRVAAAPLNNVLVVRPSGVARAAAWLDEIAADGLPHCLQTREGDTAAEDLARSRGMARGERVPFMLLADPTLAGPAPGVRPLAPDEVDLHVDAMRDGFGMPESLVAPLRGSPLLRQGGVRAYVAEDGGAVVGTALGILREGHVGVFNVATLPAHRGRGHGAALTARVVADGVAEGARAALLQSTPVAVPVYERLGFATAERWTVWTA